MILHTLLHKRTFFRTSGNRVVLHKHPPERHTNSANSFFCIPFDYINTCMIVNPYLNLIFITLIHSYKIIRSQSIQTFVVRSPLILHRECSKLIYNLLINIREICPYIILVTTLKFKTILRVDKRIKLPTHKLLQFYYYHRLRTIYRFLFLSLPYMNCKYSQIIKIAF